MSNTSLTKLALYEKHKLSTFTLYLKNFQKQCFFSLWGKKLPQIALFLDFSLLWKNTYNLSGSKMAMIIWGCRSSLLMQTFSSSSCRSLSQDIIFWNPGKKPKKANLKSEPQNRTSKLNLKTEPQNRTSKTEPQKPNLKTEPQNRTSKPNLKTEP